MVILGQQLFIFLLVSKCGQALVILYDGICQALAVGGILLRKPLLDLSCDGVDRWKSLTSGIFFSLLDT
jgi:hypothetical protein